MKKSFERSPRQKRWTKKFNSAFSKIKREKSTYQKSEEDLVGFFFEKKMRRL